MSDNRTVTAAVVQASPTFFDREGATEKVADLTAQAAADGAGLVVFPEAYVGGYPWGLAFGTTVGGRSDAAGALAALLGHGGRGAGSGHRAHG